MNEFVHKLYAAIIAIISYIAIIDGRNSMSYVFVFWEHLVPS